MTVIVVVVFGFIAGSCHFISNLLERKINLQYNHNGSRKEVFEQKIRLMSIN